MKNLVILAFLLIPSVSFAAPLTNEQATSLIAVVQSSTTTPASAFVPLITAFSSITELQATTLIEVVQAAPGVPANAFVNMLIAFTVDAPITNPTLGSTQPVVPTSQETTPAPVVETPTPTQTTPVVEAKPAIPLRVLNIQLYRLPNVPGGQGYLSVRTNKPINFASSTVTGATTGEIIRDGHQSQQEVGMPYGYEMKLENVLEDMQQGHSVTIVDVDGLTYTKNYIGYPQI